MDWTGCNLVEIIPGKVSGVPLIKGTRIPADFILEDFERGRSIAAILEDFPSVSASTIQTLIAFAHQHRPASAA